MSPAAFYVACLVWCLVCWAALIWLVAVVIGVLS